MLIPVGGVTAKILFHSGGALRVHNHFLCCAKLFNLMSSHLLILGFISGVLGVLLSKLVFKDASAPVGLEKTALEAPSWSFEATALAHQGSQHGFLLPSSLACAHPALS